MTAETQKRIMRVFKCAIPSCKYHFSNGKEANFKNHEYLTDDPKEIAELEAEVAGRHPHIYVDKNKVEVDVNEDPMQKLREKIAAEERAKILAEMSGDKTQVIGSGAASNQAGAVADVQAKLAALKTGGIASTAAVATAGDSNSK